jgi:hypothetical protein
VYNIARHKLIIYQCIISVYYLDFISCLSYYDHCPKTREGACKLLVYYYSNQIAPIQPTHSGSRRSRDLQMEPPSRDTFSSCPTPLSLSLWSPAPHPGLRFHARHPTACIWTLASPTPDPVVRVRPLERSLCAPTSSLHPYRLHLVVGFESGLEALPTEDEERHKAQPLAGAPRRGSEGGGSGGRTRRRGSVGGGGTKTKYRGSVGRRGRPRDANSSGR